MATPQKPHWLRIDFDRWHTEDDGELTEPARDVREDYVEEYNNLQKQEIGYVRGKLKTETDVAKLEIISFVHYRKR